MEKGLQNPVDKLLAAYAAFKKRWKNPSSSDCWHKSMAATVLRAGMAGNQIPDTAEMTLNFRYVKPEGKEEILQQLRALPGVEIAILESCPPVFMFRDAPEFKILERVMTQVLGGKVEYTRSSGATDARWFVTLNKPIAVLGIESAGCHGKDEKARIESIRQYAEILRELPLAL